VLQQTFRRLLHKKTGKEVKRNLLEAPVIPINRKRKLVGVIKERFYPKREDPSELIASIENLECPDKKTRETIYTSHRNAIQTVLTESESLHNSIPGTDFIETMII